MKHVLAIAQSVFSVFPVFLLASACVTSPCRADEAAKAMAETELRGDFAMFIWDAGVKMNVWDQMVSVSKVRLLKGVVPRQPDGKMGEVSGGLLMSDHASFWKADYPAVYITDTGPFRKSGFHCMLRPDDAQFIDTAFATGIVRAATVLAADRLGLLP